jgi:hypothetical protein
MQKRTLALWALLAALAGSAVATDMGTAFTYQGRLCDDGVPANGLYDFTFELYDAPDPPGGSFIDSRTLPAVFVTNGLFTTNIDFGIAPFAGQARWLKISARTNGVGAYAALGPRQELKPTPYALYAATAGTAATATTASGAPWGGLSGIPAGFLDGVDDDHIYSQGEGLTLVGGVFSVNTNFLNGRYWALAGNGGTTAGTHFVGTTDNQPLELKVNRTRALRLEPASDGLGGVHPNLNGGAPDNSILFSHGSSIGGGWSNTLSNSPAAFLGGGTGNAIRNSEQGSISGGWENDIEGSIGAAIGGGHYNQIYPGADYSVIPGGDLNVIEASSGYSTIGGGTYNRIKAGTINSTIGGGFSNEIQTNAYSATVAGGYDNEIRANAKFATIAGGHLNMILTNCTNATIAGGHLNRIAEKSPSAAIVGGDQNKIGDGSGYAFLGGGRDNSILSSGWYAFLGGGIYNTNATRESFLGGGSGNTILTNTGCSVIVGGLLNRIEPTRDIENEWWGACFIGGGMKNTIGRDSQYCAIGGGEWNEIKSVMAATIGGGSDNYVGTNIFTDEFVTFTNVGDYAFIGGGSYNAAYGTNATVVGGSGNKGYGNYSLVGGGYYNVAGGPEIPSSSASAATVAGGQYNEASAPYSTVGGGTSNLAAAEAATIPGGKDARAWSYGQHAYASGSFPGNNRGDAQTSVYVLRGQFTGNTVTNELFLDGSSARMWMPADSTWAYDILVVARTASTLSVAWHIRGVIENNGGVTALDGIPLQQKDQLNDDFTGDVIVGANDVADALVINVWNGNTASAVRWVATVRTAEVTFP